MILIGRGLDLKRFVKEKFLKSNGSRSEPEDESESDIPCAVLKVRKQKRDTISGDNSLRDPPVPIPNTEVKPQHADSTWLETAR